MVSNSTSGHFPFDIYTCESLSHKVRQRSLWPIWMQAVMQWCHISGISEKLHGGKYCPITAKTAIQTLFKELSFKKRMDDAIFLH